MLKDIISLALKWIVYRKLRSWLTILWIILGVMLVIIILSLWDWIQRAISKQMQMIGTNVIFIIPWSETNPLAWLAWWLKFKISDLIKLEKINGVELVTPWNMATFNIEFKWEKKWVMTNSTSWKWMIKMFEEAQWVKLQEWAWPKNDSVNEVVFWYLSFKKLFKNKLEIGDEVLIKSKKMKIAWFISEIWNQQDDNSIYMSGDNFEGLTGIKWKASTVMIKIKEWSNLDLISKQIKFELNKQEIVKDFAVVTPQKANSLIWNVLNLIEIFLIIIALTSLLVWAVWITNTMYTSVLERTKQIWIMKAIWANKDAILTLFLIESGIIGLVWWIIGISLGLLLSYGIWTASEAQWAANLFSFAEVDYVWVLSIWLVTFIVWTISWYLPAKQASNLEAAEALRYE